jgi:hydroxymethylbilane synthase
MHITLATRRSALALAQSRAFVARLIAANPGLEVTELQIVTAGDRIQDRPLYESGGKGLFVKEIEEALLDGRADIAIHSMKDLPADLPPGLDISCVPERADPRDVLLVPDGREATLAALPQGARVGSSSLRRRMALLAVRPDLKIELLRGNVDTRLRRLRAGEFDATLLAAAGLARLGISDLPPHCHLATETWLPAVAQGILAVEARSDDTQTAALLAPLEHAPSRRMSLAERAVLKALGADCTVPLAAFLEDDILKACLWGHDGRAHLAQMRVEADPVSAGWAVGQRLAEQLRI